ncbi:MAG: transcription-repair coupling factor [Bacteroidetes bacterium]|nr:transcription-repair coupling factor [Bacteroidota bacterium]
MDIKELLHRYSLDERTQLIKAKTNSDTPQSLHLTGLVGSVLPFIISSLVNESKKQSVIDKVSRSSHLVILPNKEEAAYFQNDLQNIFNHSYQNGNGNSNLLKPRQVLFFTDSYKKPGHFEHVNNANLLMRAEVLDRIYDHELRKKSDPEVIVTYPEALFEKAIQKESFKKHTFSFKEGDTLDVDGMIDLMLEYEFERTDFIYEAGQYAIRGGIIDIFSFAKDYPYRIELSDDKIESIRFFDPETQLSVSQVKKVKIIPDLQSKFLNERRENLFKLLPKDTVVWAKDLNYSLEIIDSCELNLSQMKDIVLELPEDDDETVDLFRQDPENFFSTREEQIDGMKNYSIIEYGNQFFHPVSETITYNITPQPSFNKNFDLLIRDLKKSEEEERQTIIFADNPKQIERFYQIFEDLEAEVQFYTVPLAIHEGFIDHDLGICFYTDHQIFNRYHKYKLRKSFSKSVAMALKELKELKPGDFVTHIDHGIGVYSGLEKIEVNESMQEAIRILYKENDILYVSISSLHKVSKYVGKDGTPPKLNKLGSGAWENLKRKTKKKVKDIAKDLIKLYATRKSTQGYAFAPDSYLQTELEASFEYEDTPDQLKVTAEIKKDQEAEHPMDRLICGDVGFGKTELAIRAAFKVVADSKQVAVLVPTTILAFQHYKTFSDRLENFPCTVEYINRFKSTKQQNESFERLAKGEIDIIIGTHKLLSKDVKFKDLGLLIIDEEQKFGVSQKEKIRQFRSNVDTLSMTATPIPRTLQFSLMGARDLSVIQTPPPNRQPVQTEVHLFNQDMIRDAINYEVSRGGQVFFVHNQIKDIREIADIVSKLCPDVSLIVAHGRLDGKTLERTMVDFIAGKYDVLISTSIIESGIDIPNANTIIVNNAHHFGLSDLHQLRGRVGRSDRKAFCYLIAPPQSVITADSRRRLKAIEEYSELGSGFSIALRDLDIRGAGNMLGAEQSGFIAEIGLDTFHKILDEAIHELKTDEFKEVFADEIIEKKDYVRDCQIETDLEIMIPDDYINSINERLSIYTQLDNLESEEALQDYQEELVDRFGPLPAAVRELLSAIRLRWLAKALGFEKIGLKQGMMKCFFIKNQNSLYFESEIFSGIMQYIQGGNTNSQIKQTASHLILIFGEVNSVNKAIQLLKDVEAHLEQEVTAKPAS